MAGGLGLSDHFYNKAKGLRILVYHGICLKDHTRFNSLFQTLKTFESHLKYYKKYFTMISLDDVFRDRLDPNRFNLCLSFDDGFANNYKYVAPLLEKYKVPAVFFVTGIRDAGYGILWNDFLAIVSKYGPGRINIRDVYYAKDRWGRYVSEKTGQTLAAELRCKGFEAKKEMMEKLEPIVPFRDREDDKDFWMQMTKSEIAALSSSPWATIGSHGYYHNDLAQIDIADARKEMDDSKKYLEEVTGKQINAIAFPYGAYSESVLSEARMAGYTQLLSDRFLRGSDEKELYLKERFTVNPFITIHHQLRANIKGKY